MSVINRIKEYFSEKWEEYQKEKKSDALYNKLHKYDNVKFSQKQWVKDAKAFKKQKMKKDAAIKKDIRDANKKRSDVNNEKTE